MSNPNARRRLAAIINSLSKLQLEEGVADADLGAAKAKLSKVHDRWERRPSFFNPPLRTTSAIR